MASDVLSIGADAQTLTLAGRRFVVVPERDYLRLRMAAGEDEPPMPQPDAKGNYPAAEALAVSIARSILRERRALGLSQVELARRAGIRAETLNRVERGKFSPSVATLEKLDRALKAAQAPEQAKARPKRRKRK